MKMEKSCILLLALMGAVAAYWDTEPDTYTCCASGDPHYNLFDGQWIHYQGMCKYLMAGTCHDCDDCDHDPFHVYVDNRPWAYNSAMSITDLVEIHYNGYVVVFQNGVAPKVNGAAVGLPYVGPNFIVSSPSSNHFVFEATNGIVVTYQWGHRACVTVPNCLYRGQMCGICGNMNNIPDDYFTSDGTDVSGDPDKFNKIGDSWEVAGGDCSRRRKRAATRTEEIRSPCCEALESSTSPFRDCIAKYGAMIAGYKDSCFYDARAAGSDRGCCMMVQALADACEEKGVAARGWQDFESFRHCKEQ